MRWCRAMAATGRARGNGRLSVPQDVGPHLGIARVRGLDGAQVSAAAEQREGR